MSTEENSDGPVSAPDSLAARPEADRQNALERYRLLRPHLEDGRFLKSVAAEAGIAYRTAVRWVAQYRHYGLAALIRGGRADKGARRALSPSIREAVEGMALSKPALPVATIHRKISGAAVELGGKAFGYHVVYDIIRQLPADLTMLAREGTKAYSDTFDLVHRQEAVRPNAVWQADHCLLDILIPQQSGEPARPWLTVVIDDFSRAIAGYFLSFDAPSSIRTALALRQAIWRKEDPRWRICGIPEVLYTDNGSDFTSRHLEQVAADLKIRLVFSIPGHPRGRGRIERFFSSINQLCLSALPGYAPPGSGPRGPSSLTLPDLDARLLEFFLNEYHQRPHSATGVPPRDRWENGGFLPQMPSSLERLDLLLLTVAKSRRVHADGIRFQGLRYVDPVLAAYVGETVTLRYDPRDVAEVRLFHEGKFLCRAICPELAGETISLRDILRARGQRRRDLRATIQNRHETVEALLKLKRGEPSSGTGSETFPEPSVPLPQPPRLKRYFNE
jgi:putative transposase